MLVNPRVVITSVFLAIITTVSVGLDRRVQAACFSGSGEGWIRNPESKEPSKKTKGKVTTCGNAFSEFSMFDGNEFYASWHRCAQWAICEKKYIPNEVQPPKTYSRKTRVTINASVRDGYLEREGRAFCVRQMGSTTTYCWKLVPISTR